MTATVGTYVAYLLVSVALTAWVGWTLARNGKVFLTDVFGGDEGLAEAVNRLLVVGFYLVNLGFVALYLRAGQNVHDLRGAFDTLSVKVGIVLLVLGVLHLGNVWIFNRMRRRSMYGGLYRPEPAPGPRPQAQPQVWTRAGSVR
jgi:hypothetical protein